MGDELSLDCVEPFEGALQSAANDVGAALETVCVVFTKNHYKSRLVYLRAGPEGPPSHVPSRQRMPRRWTCADSPGRSVSRRSRKSSSTGAQGRNRTSDTVIFRDPFFFS